MTPVLTERLVSEISLRPCSNTTTTTQSPEDRRIEIIASLYTSQLSTAYQMQNWDRLYGYLWSFASALTRDLYVAGNSNAASFAASSILEELGFDIGDRDEFGRRLAEEISTSNVEGAVALMQQSLTPPVNAHDESWTEEKNARRRELIDTKIQGSLTATEMGELDDLQRQAIAYRDAVAPPPLEAAGQLHKELLEKKRQQEQQDE